MYLPIRFLCTIHSNFEEWSYNCFITTQGTKLFLKTYSCVLTIFFQFMENLMHLFQLENSRFCYLHLRLLFKTVSPFWEISHFHFLLGYMIFFKKECILPENERNKEVSIMHDSEHWIDLYLLQNLEINKT